MQISSLRLTLLIDNDSKGNLKLSASGGGLISRITEKGITIASKNFSQIIPGNTSFFEFSTKGNIWLEIRDCNHNLLYRSTINGHSFYDISSGNNSSLAIRKKEGKLGTNVIRLLEFSSSNAEKNNAENWLKRMILKIKGFPE